MAALSAADVLSLLKTGRADVGAIPGNIVPDDCIRIGTIVDSAAGCTFVTRLGALKHGAKSNSSKNRRQDHPENQLTRGIETRALAEFISEARENGREVRIGIEENTIAHEFLRDICEHSRLSPSAVDRKKGPLSVNDLKWTLRSNELATKPFADLEKDCNAELLGVIVWDPHATWMTMIEEGLEKIQIHFAPSELGRPHHLSYELVVRSPQMNRVMNPKSKELVSAIRKLMFELWDSASRLNSLRDDSADDNLIKQLSEYYRFQTLNETAASKKRTLEAVGSILYSVRWDTKGL